MILLKLLPSPVAKFLAYTELANRLSYFFSYGSRSLAEVVNSLTENKELRAVLCYIFGTYGEITQLVTRAVASIFLTAVQCSLADFKISQLLTTAKEQLLALNPCFNLIYVLYHRGNAVLSIALCCVCRSPPKRSQFLHAQFAGVPLPAWCLVP